MAPWCRCGAPKPSERRTGGGDVIAILCAGCTRTIKERCRVCGDFFAQLAVHLGKTTCGEFDRRGMWWTTERPPNAGHPRAVAMLKQLEMFK